jgi:hypothetical protein
MKGASTGFEIVPLSEVPTMKRLKHRPILGCMEPPNRNWLAAFSLLEVFRRFEAARRPGKLIPWPTKRGPSRSQGEPRS